MTRPKRIGIVTGGGDCPGLNPVIRAVVKTAVQDYGMSAVGIEDGFNGLLGDGPAGLIELDGPAIRGILHQGGTIIGTTNNGHPFRFPVRAPDGSVHMEDRSALLPQRLKEHGIEALVIVGGDGTMAIAQQLHTLGIPVVGVPKTIDNDLSVTDTTFGFDTACNICMEAIDRLHTTAASHDRAMFIEVMGRHVGWIALSSGLAGGADVILIPEIPYRAEQIVEKIQQRQARGRNFSIIVVAEGAMPVGGGPSMLPNPFSGGRPSLGGAAQRVALEVAGHIDLEIRVTVLGHVQRGGSPSHLDRVLGTRFGHAAARLVAEGRWGQMVCLRGTEITSCAISDAIGQLKAVDPLGQLVQTARSAGISFGD